MQPLPKRDLSYEDIRKLAGESTTMIGEMIEEESKYLTYVKGLPKTCPDSALRLFSPFVCMKQGFQNFKRHFRVAMHALLEETAEFKEARNFYVITSEQGPKDSPDAVRFIVLLM